MLGRVLGNGWSGEGFARPTGGVGLVMARRTEPLRGSCTGRNRKAWGNSEYSDERKGVGTMRRRKVAVGA